jgi:hypothetical protein
LCRSCAKHVISMSFFSFRFGGRPYDGFGALGREPRDRRPTFE